MMQPRSQKAEIPNTSGASVVSGRLLAMDMNCLAYLLEVDGRAHAVSIPARLFDGVIPEGHPNLVDRGLVENDGDDVVITPLGRATAAAMGINAGDLCRPAACEVQP